MESRNQRINIPQSDAIWISNKPSVNQPSTSNRNIGFRNSLGSSCDSTYSFDSLTSSNTMSPPDFKRSMSTNSYPRDSNMEPHKFGSYSRRRTMTVASDNDMNSFSSFPQHDQSPFRRSNSISGTEPNFGGIIKRSIGQLFNAATVNTSLATATIQKSVPKVKCVPMMNAPRKNSQDRNDHFTDHIVSYLCESAIR